MAAPLAHPVVDGHPGPGRADFAPLAVSAQFSRAPLVVDEHGYPGHRGQLLLDFGQLGAVSHIHLGGKLKAAGAARIVGGYDDAGHALGQKRPAHPVEGDAAGGILPSSHGHGAVPQQLVGDVDSRGDGCGHGQLAGVEERAVAHVLDQMGGFHEWGHANPLGALAAHAGEPGDVAVALFAPQQDHGVAADPGTHRGVGVGDCAAIVGAARAEVRGAIHRQGDPLPSRGLGSEAVADAAQTMAQRSNEIVGVEGAIALDEMVIVLIELSDHQWAVGFVVQRVFDSRLHVGGLLLDDEDLLQACGERADCGGVERNRHAHAEHSDAGVGDLDIAA